MIAVLGINILILVLIALPLYNLIVSNMALLPFYELSWTDFLYDNHEYCKQNQGDTSMAKQFH